MNNQEIIIRISHPLDLPYLEDWICTTRITFLGQNDLPQTCQQSSYLERAYTLGKEEPWRDFEAIEGHYQGWQCRYMEGRVNDRITDRVVPRTDDLVSLVSRAPERGSIRSQSVHRRDKCQGQTREPKFRHFTVRYVFGYSPANVPPFSLSPHDSSTGIPHKTLPRLRPFLAVVGNWVIRWLLECRSTKGCGYGGCVFWQPSPTDFYAKNTRRKWRKYGKWEGDSGRYITILIESRLRKFK